jgi:hypothetical protein
VTCPGGKYKDFLKWSSCNGRFFQVEKYKDFGKWTYCNGLPTKVKKYKDILK